MNTTKKSLFNFIWMIALAIIPCVKAQIIDTFDSINPGWVTDRYDPAGFSSSFFDGDNRLKIDISSADSQANRPGAFSSSFYNTQGKQLAVNQPGSWTLGIDLYLDTRGWTGLDVSTGLWGVGQDATNTISAYPIIAYRQGSIAASGDGFYWWDYVNGGYSFLTGGNSNSWNAIDIVFTAGVGAQFLVNGTSLASISDPDTVRLSGIILNTSNYGENYTVYMDNLRCGAVPEPSTYGMIGAAALLGLIVVRRRFKK